MRWTLIALIMPAFWCTILMPKARTRQSEKPGSRPTLSVLTGRRTSPKQSQGGLKSEQEGAHRASLNPTYLGAFPAVCFQRAMSCLWSLHLLFSHCMLSFNMAGRENATRLRHLRQLLCRMQFGGEVKEDVCSGLHTFLVGMIRCV